MSSQAPKGERSLSIGEVSDRTGLAVPTLRAWEARYGFPVPDRLEAGHRRYSERDCLLLAEVVREREGGLSLETAIARVLASAARPEPSIFAGLRRRRPELEPRLFRKPSMLAVTRAIEDECCARAARPILFGSFQRERHYRASERRWRELSRTAEHAVAFADFPARRDPAGGPAELPLESAAPLRREWAIVCDAPGFSACLAGWETERGLGDADRTFETIWTAEPAVVREAARIALGLAREVAPDLATKIGAHLRDTPPPSADALRRTIALTNRMVAYLALP